MSEDTVDVVGAVVLELLRAYNTIQEARRNNITNFQNLENWERELSRELTVDDVLNRVDTTKLMLIATKEQIEDMMNSEKEVSSDKEEITDE